MALIDNPFLQAVGAHLGLSSVFNQAMQNAAIKPGVSKPSPSESKGNPDFATFRYMQRMMSPRFNGGGDSGVRLAAPQGAIDPESLNSPETQSLLAQFGQTGHVQPDPNLFIHNPTAHPILGNLLDRALTGMAYTTGDASNPGAIMHNVAAGLLAGNQARQEQVNNQLEMPFQQAAQVAGLQKDAASLQTALDQQAELKARADADAARAAKDRTPVTPPEHNPEWGFETQEMQARMHQAVAANGGKPLNDAQIQDVLTKYRQDVAQDKASGKPLSPMGQYFQSVTDQYMHDNPNATEVPPSAYVNAFGQLAGSRAKAQAPYKKSAGGKAARDPLLPLRVSDLKQQYQDVERKLDAANKYGSLITDDNGHILLQDSAPRKAYMDGLRAQQKQISDQLNGILYPTQSGASTVSSKQKPASNTEAPPIAAFANHAPGTVLRKNGTGPGWKLINGQVTQVK